MKKDYQNKQVTTESSKSLPKKIRCTQECVIPWVGHFLVGEEVKDQGKIAAIGDNPNFQIVNEEA